MFLFFKERKMFFNESFFEFFDQEMLKITFYLKEFTSVLTKQRQKWFVKDFYAISN